MFGFSLGEVLFLGVLALIVIGPKQLPEVARHVGRFLNDLKRATEGFTDDIKRQAKVDFDFESRVRRPLDQPDEPENPVLPPKTPEPGAVAGENQPVTGNPTALENRADAPTGAPSGSKNEGHGDGHQS